MERKFWILIIALLIPISVKAKSCETITNNDSYYLDRYRSISSLPFQIPLGTTKIQHLAVNTNIKDNSIIYNGSFLFSYNGRETGNTVVESITYSSQQLDIRDSCVTTNDKRFSGNDQIITHTDETITINCEFTGTLTNGNRITIVFNLENTDTLPYTYNYGNQCLEITPSETSQIINNDNRNAMNIQNQIENISDQIENTAEQIENNLSEQTNEIMNGIQNTQQDLAPYSTSNITSAQTKEDGLLQNLDPDIIDNTINFNNTIDSNAWEWIWWRISRIITIDTTLAYTIFAILGFGIIKLVLGR